MEKNVVIKIEDEPEELEEFMQVLVGTGIKCRIQKDIHQGNESLQMCFCWDEAEVLRRRTRKAGAKRRRTLTGGNHGKGSTAVDGRNFRRGSR